MKNINLYKLFVSNVNRNNVDAEVNKVRESAVNWQKENDKEIKVIGSKASYQALSEEIGVFTIIVEYQVPSEKPDYFFV